MTTTVAPHAPATTHPFVASGSGLSFGGLLNSEWIKLRTVRSTIWSYATVIVISLGMALLMSSTLTLEGTQVPASDQANWMIQVSTFGIIFGQLVVAVLGVLSISGEYSTGMVRSSLTAVPRRLPVLAAKAVVLFVCTYVVGLISVVGSYLVASPIMSGKGISASLADPDLFLPLMSAALYLSLVAVFSLGLGTILRSSAGGIAAALGIILLLPTVLQLIPATWVADLLPYVLSNAGTASFLASPPLEPWQNILVVLGWVAVALAGAAVLLKRRDA
ncbi:ABC transporter permease subunit [Cryobacterium sp. PAMC25264]|uniref:ABC transporter permease subunit n=1 Tax=Cryobacterium sp. PAMC25264 TaxID=2861288 RepID=UPI001C63120B|nr:ABC transporter permease subunit [Cryobacterium sp. PAMC25264]QYF72856.1 ABC transporter permease [Cryobacterium sp. PAMC25264]